MHRRSFLSLTALAAVGVPLVTACEDDPVATIATSSATSSAGAPGGRREDGSVATSFHYRQHEVTAAFGPAVVHDNLAVLRVQVLAVTPLDGATQDPPQLGLPWQGAALLASGTRGIRVLDLEAATVAESVGAENTLLDTADLVPASSTPSPGTGSGGRTRTLTTYCAFQAPADGVTSVNLLVPRVGLVEDVAVLGEDDSPFDAPTALHICGDLDRDAGTPVAISSFVTSYDLSTSVQQEGKEVTMALGSDLLFDPDSSTLGPDADATLRQVADELATYGGGALTITGHTDDVADDAHNQTLSEQRAQALSDRLGQLTDLSSYTVTVQGKGEGEPKVDNTDDASRALNRRVEIAVTTESPAALPDVNGEGTDQASASPSAVAPQAGEELPETSGPIVSNDEVEIVWGDGGTLVVGTPTVRRVGGYLLGTLVVRGGAEGSGVSVGSWLAPDLLVTVRGQMSLRLAFATSGVRLLGQGQRYFPLDYVKASDGDTYWPLTEVMAEETLVAGEEMTVTVWWPDPGTDTVVLDYASTSSWIPEDALPSWRITDVPVDA